VKFHRKDKYKMSLYLKQYEACKYGPICPYNNKTNAPFFCQGAQSERSTEFICDLVSENGIFSESGFRSPHDLTGKMKVIVE